MPDPASESAPPARARKALAGLAGWLPALAAALAALAGALWWLQRCRSQSCSCRPSAATGECPCARRAVPAAGARRCPA
jgi:ferric-dicitrate binding protein FerR (iron transport regulator)